MVDLLSAHQHCSNHRSEIEASTVCGCFHCMQTFAPAEIIAWSGGEARTLEELAAAADAGTALCPRCGSESVIGDKSGYEITPQFLSQMHEAWYRRTIIYKRPKK